MQTLLKRIDALLDNNPEIFGSTVAFEPYAFDPKTRAFAPYAFREGQSLKHINLGDNDYRTSSGTGTRSRRSWNGRYGASPISTRGPATS